MGEEIDEFGSNADFHTLDGVHHDEAESAVECVPAPHRLKCSSLLEVVAAVLPKRVGVAAQPVVAHASQLIGLVFKSQRWLGVLHESPREKERPARVSMQVQRLGEFADTNTYTAQEGRATRRGLRGSIRTKTSRR